MRNIELLDKYNNLLSQDLGAYRLQSWNQLEKLSKLDLEKLFKFFTSKIMEEIDSNGELSPEGILCDEIAGKINACLIQMSK